LSLEEFGRLRPPTSILIRKPPLCIDGSVCGNRFAPILAALELRCVAQNHALGRSRKLEERPGGQGLLVDDFDMCKLHVNFNELKPSNPIAIYSSKRYRCHNHIEHDEHETRPTTNPSPSYLTRAKPHITCCAPTCQDPKPGEIPTCQPLPRLPSNRAVRSLAPSCVT
jgi:hypothetical protein